MTAVATAIADKILKWLTGLILGPMNWLYTQYVQSGGLIDFMGTPWASGIVAGAQGIAGGLLALRVTWEAYEIAALRAEGAPTDPGGLLKRSMAAAAGIFAGPWLTTQFIQAGNDLALWIGSAGLLPSGGADYGAILEAALTGMGAFWIFVGTLVALLMLILVGVQAAARSVEMLIAGVVSPFMALGYVSGGGTADAWLREVIILAVSQAVQVLTVHLAFTALALPANLGLGAASVLFFLAAMWVAYRTPHVLRHYAYSTGTRGVAAAGAGMAQRVGMQMILGKLGW